MNLKAEDKQTQASPVDWKKIREDFPILNTKVRDKQLVYFDNGATTQKPIQVIEAEREFYLKFNSNVHRGVHYLSNKATDLYEEARENVKQFIGAQKHEEIIFTSGTTDAINLVAMALSRGVVGRGDEILITAMEHHSNIVPWQLLCETTGAILKYIPITQSGDLDENWKSYITPKTRLVAMTHVSNTLGTINPVKTIVDYCNQKGIMTLIDGAQAVLHEEIDVQDLNCTFYVFSGHKMLGPTGIGVLYGKYEVLCELPPYKGGGDMIEEVTLEKSTFQKPPFRFEAGTPPFAQAVGLSEAIKYIGKIGKKNIKLREEQLKSSMQKVLDEFKEITIYGTGNHKIATFSFLINNVHPYDIGTLLDNQGVAVRTGHHCTQPIMQFFNIPGTVRASLAFYNNEEEIEIFRQALTKTKQMLLA
ncbi:MAG: cysteine desulfurase [Vicingaceae bacterium]|nr:MAG: cysteine desulfurase [Vicingaceae bacterium]